MQFFFILGGSVLLLFSVDRSFWVFGGFEVFLQNSSQFLSGFPTRRSTPKSPKYSQWEEGHMDVSQDDSPKNSMNSVKIKINPFAAEIV